MINENIYMNFVNLSLSLIVPLQKYNKYYGDHLDDLMFFFLLIDVSSSADVCWLFVVCDVPRNGSGEFINYIFCIVIFLFIIFKELNIKILVLSQLEIRTLHFVTYTTFK